MIAHDPSHPFRLTPDELRALADALIECGEDAWPTVPEPIRDAAAYLRQCADAQPVAMLASHRRLIEQAIQSAEHPSGMSTHDGKARIDASVLRRMLSIIDSRPAPAAPQAESIDPHMIVAEDRFPDEQAAIRARGGSDE